LSILFPGSSKGRHSTAKEGEMRGGAGSRDPLCLPRASPAGLQQWTGSPGAQQPPDMFTSMRQVQDPDGRSTPLASIHVLANHY